MGALIAIIVVSWLISGLIGAAIGSTRGRSGAGFVLGAFLGFFGWIIVAMMGPTAAHEARRSAEVSALQRPSLTAAVSRLDRPCPWCGEDIKRSAKICRFCCHEIPQDDLASIASPELANAFRDAPDGLRAFVERLTQLRPAEVTILAESIPRGPTAKRAYDAVVAAAEGRGYGNFAAAVRAAASKSGHDADLPENVTEAWATAAVIMALRPLVGHDDSVRRNDAVRQFLSRPGCRALDLTG